MRKLATTVETIISAIESVWVDRMPAAALSEDEEEAEELELELVPVEELPDPLRVLVLAPGELISFSSSGTTARSEMTFPSLSLTVTVTE